MSDKSDESNKAGPAAQCNRACRHWSYDMDGAYCEHPGNGNSHGIALHSLAIVEFCPAPQHPRFEPSGVSKGGSGT